MAAADLLHPVLLHHIVNSLQWPALRPLQSGAVTPLLAGDDALLLAPTAAGKTEAALFPLLSRMAQENWSGPGLLSSSRPTFRSRSTRTANERKLGVVEI